MSQRMKIIAGALALILGAVATGWLYFQLSPGAWEQFMAEMEGETAAQPENRPAVRRPTRRSGSLVASGNIEAEKVTVAAEIGG